jgi:hypothetical protein
MPQLGSQGQAVELTPIFEIPNPEHADVRFGGPAFPDNGFFCEVILVR